MEHFNEKSPTESVILTFNFALALAPLTGVLLLGPPIVTFALVYGGDANPSALANGPASVDPTGTLVWVPVTAGLDQNNYMVTVECPTTNGAWALTLAAILPVRAFPSMPGVP